MDTYELEEKLALDSKTYATSGGVYALDQLPSHVHRRPLLLIANTQPSFLSGRHWVVVYIGVKETEFFDPLGQAPNATLHRYLLGCGSGGYLRNETRVQGDDSSKCGQFCLYYCYFRSRGFALRCILQSLTMDYAVNDYIVEQLVHRYME